MQRRYHERGRSIASVSSFGFIGRTAASPRTQLVELWIKHVGCPPPKAASTPLLLRAIAYAVQEQQFGGLKRRELRLLHKTIESGEIRANVQKAPNSKMREGHKRSPSNGEPGSMQRALRSPKAVRIALRPGTRLVREWQGKSHSVDVRADGFAWNGTVYRSLSAVALAITGARWSGNRFFRL